MSEEVKQFVMGLAHFCKKTPMYLLGRFWFEELEAVEKVGEAEDLEEIKELRRENNLSFRPTEEHWEIIKIEVLKDERL